jgi:cytochrome c1
MKIVMAEEQMRQSRAAIRQVFEATHRLDLWNEIQAKTAEARKNRQAFLKAEEARKKKFRKELGQYAMIFVVVVVLVPATIGGLLTWLTNR